MVGTAYNKMAFVRGRIDGQGHPYTYKRFKGKIKRFKGILDSHLMQFFVLIYRNLNNIHIWRAKLTSMREGMNHAATLCVEDVNMSVIRGGV